jgi:hypothetical protein
MTKARRAIVSNLLNKGADVRKINKVVLTLIYVMMWASNVI